MVLPRSSFESGSTSKELSNLCDLRVGKAGLPPLFQFVFFTLWRANGRIKIFPVPYTMSQESFLIAFKSGGKPALPNPELLSLNFDPTLKGSHLKLESRPRDFAKISTKTVNKSFWTSF